MNHDQLASVYETGPDLTLYPWQLNAIKEWIAAAFHRLPVVVSFEDKDPYSNASDMFTGLDSTGRLQIFAGGEHPYYLTREENLWFRALHDWAHYQARSDFDLVGEHKAYKMQVKLAQNYFNGCVPLWLKQFLFSEIVLQAAASISSGEFPKQRLVAAPVELI